MGRYVFLRLTGLIPTLFLITLISFAIIFLAPGDPATLLLQHWGNDPTQEAVQELRESMGLDRSPAYQYVAWLGQVCRGNLGYSFFTGEPVIREILLRMPATLELAGAAMLFSLGLALLMGLVAAKCKDRWPDHLGRLLGVVAVAMPTYWIGLVLIYLLAIAGQWLPAVGRGGLENLIMPAISLGLASASIHSRLFRESVLETLSQEFVRYAKAKGLSSWQVIRYHAIRPSLVPFVTSAGTTFGQMLGGSVIVESIFAWPGVGKMMMEAVFNRDYPLIQGYVLIMAVVYTLVNLATDLACVWIDPRMRLDKERIL